MRIRRLLATALSVPVPVPDDPLPQLPDGFACELVDAAPSGPSTSSPGADRPVWRRGACSRAAWSTRAPTRVPRRSARSAHGPEPSTAKLFVARLADDAPRVRRAAADALARRGERAAAPALLAALEAGGDPFLRFTLRRALAACSGWDVVAEHLPFVTGDVLYGDCLQVFFERAEPGAVEALAGIVRSSDAPYRLRADALELLAGVARRPEPWDGVWWSIQPARTHARPRGALDWEETPRVLALLRGALSDVSPRVRERALVALRAVQDREALPLVRARWPLEHDGDVRAALLETLAELRDAGAAELLEALILGDERWRGRALDAACRIASPSMVDLLVRLVEDEGTADAQLAPCLDALGRLGDPGSVRALWMRTSHAAPAVRRAAARAVARVLGEAAVTGLEPLLEDPDPGVRAGAARIFGELGARATVPALLRLAREPETAYEASLALARMPDPRALRVYLAALESGSEVLARGAREALVQLRDDLREILDEQADNGELAPRVLAVLRAVYSEPTPVLEWRLLGPFAKDARPAAIAAGRLDEDALAEDAMAEGRERGWFEHAAEPPHGFVDLEPLFEPHEMALAYASTWIRSRAARTAELSLGSDDQVRAWLNGEEVFAFEGARGWSPDQDAFEVTLQPGRNHLLLEIGQDRGQWALSARVSQGGTGPLFAGELELATLDDYRAVALGGGADARRGERVFFAESGPRCALCHTVDGRGTAVGPDLSDVGAKYAREEILASILEPSARLLEGYESWTLRTVDGLLHSGQVLREEDGRIELALADGTRETLWEEDVEERAKSSVSLMPDGLVHAMSPEELRDLVAWLASRAGGR